MVINRIIKRRKELGYTQGYMADIIGITPNSYRHLEIRKTQLTVSNLELIAKIFDTPIEWFFGDFVLLEEFKEAGFKIFDLECEINQLKNEIIDLQRKLIKANNL